MADSSSQQPSLTVLGGPMGGQRLVLDDAVANLLIGSDPSCDFYLPHDTVSPIHARLWVDLEGAVLHETSSPHGVYVNDTRVSGKHPLHNGDIVWLGSPGGADVVMIQCTLAEKQPAADAVPEVDAAADDAAERDALDSLAPTLAAGPSLADLGDEPPPIPRSAPPSRPAAPAEVEDDDSRTVAFKLPADFAAALASPPPQPPAPPPPMPRPAEPPPPPVAAGPVDDFDALLAQPDPEPPPPVTPEPEPYLAEPEAYVPEPAPVLAEPEPEPMEPDPTVLMYADEAPAPIPEPAPPRPVEPGSDFDDMVFSVPDEPPPVRAAAAVPELPAAPAEQETVLLPPPPRAEPPAPPVAAPAKAPPAAAPPRPPAARPATPPARPATTPGPRASAPAAVRPPRPAPRVERAPAEAPEPVEQAPSRGLPLAALAGGALLLVAVGAGAYWYLNRAEPVQEASVPAPSPSLVATPPPVTAPAVEPSPEPVPTAEALPPVAPPEDVVTIVRSATPPPRVVPSAAPTVAATPRPVPTRRPDTVDPAAAARARIAAQVTTLLAQAHAAAAGRNYDSAASLYDEALRLDPQNAAALTGKAGAASARAHARRTFVTGRTAVQTEKARGGGLAGFDSSDVKVQKAPDFQGRIEFAMTPSSVQPGDPWTLKVYVVNEGKKAIKISALSVATVVNGSRSGTGGAPRNREIAPQQRVIVDELSGTWPAGVTSWSTDVKVTAGKNDTLQSQLTWR